MSSMNFPEDFAARDNEQVGVMSIDTAAETIFIDMWQERVCIEGKTEWPLGGSEWTDMLKRNGLKIKRGKRQTNVVRK